MVLMSNTPRRAAALLVGLALAAFAFTASASAAPRETQQGARTLSEVQAGRLQATSLTAAQYQHVGQYLMSRALGSTSRYEAMDSLMDRTMGQQVADQMYLYAGERYLGRNVSPNGGYTRFYGWMASMMSRYGGHYAAVMGSYMMGAYDSLSGSGSLPYAGMMGAYPSHVPLGPGMMGAYNPRASSSSGGWSTAGVIAASVLGAALLAALLVLAVPRLRHRRERRPATPVPGRP